MNTERPVSRRFAMGTTLVAGFAASRSRSSKGLELNNADTDEATETVLWQGDSLEGWQATDFFGAGSTSVRRGVLTLGKGKPMTGVTWRGGMPSTNFELQFSARRVEGNDFFAAATFPVDDGFLTFVNGGWSGNVTGLSSIDGADASENETGLQYKFRNEVWYHFLIRVKGRHVVVQVNDESVIQFDGTGRSLKTRVESRPSQPLGFASYGCVGEIRDAKLRRILPDRA